MTIALVLSLDEAAGKFGVSRRTLLRLIAGGALPKYRKPGDRRTFVDTEQLKKALGFQRVEVRERRRRAKR